jgi:hypothetical protein
MPVLDMSRLNTSIGICGVVSTLAAVYSKRPGAQHSIDVQTSGGSDALTYVYDIICGFLSYLDESDDKEVIQETEAITKSFGGVYASWTVKGYLTRGRLEEDVKGGRYAMALTPKGILALLEFLGMRGVLSDKEVSGDAIIGLTRSGAPANRWGNLAHWAYRSSDGTWLNHGKTYQSLSDLNLAAGRDYSAITWISLHG